MRTVVALLVFAIAIAAWGAGKAILSQENDPLAKQIIQMERDALERWNKGDPSGFIDMFSEDVVYFDPTLDRRLDRKENLTKLYESIRGKIHADKYEMPNAKVQAVKDMAVLTFNLISVEKGKEYRWNCTEVYALEKDGKWRIIQSHWSPTKPDKK